MADWVYPLRVVFFGGTDDEELAIDGFELHGPFRHPGDLWTWANRECYLNLDPGLRDDVNAIIHENAAKGLREIKTALDEWARHDLEEYDYPGASRAHVLQGDAA